MNGTPHPPRLATLLAACLAAVLPSGAEEFHRLRFFLDPELTRELTPEEVGRRLTLYVADLNAIFAKQTIRRFAFDPRTDVTMTREAPHDGIGQFPRTGFEIWAWVRKSDNPLFGTYGGYLGFDTSGAGVASDLHWDAVHDPTTLVDVPGFTPALIQYWRQLHNLTHEIQHVFGAGTGEYYRIASVKDSTGLPPRADIRYAERATDPFWSRHPDFWNDPLLGWQPGLSYRELTNQVRFARVSAAIVDAAIRDRWSEAMPDTRPTEIRVRARDTAAPVPSARVRVWKVVALPAGDALPFADVDTDEAGLAVIDWDPAASNFNMLLLVKAYPADGRAPAARWYSIFDAQEQRMVEGLARARIDLEIPAPEAGAAPPAFVVPPEHVTARDDERVVLHASVTGTPPLAFHWILDGVPVAVTPLGRLERTNVVAPTPLSYSVIASNAFGTVASAPATLTVVPSADTVRALGVWTATGPSVESSAGVAVDDAGNRLWLASFQGPGTMLDRPVRGLPGAISSALARIDPAGRTLWLREIGPPPTGTDPATTGAIQGRALGVDATGAGYVAGWFVGNVDLGGILLTNRHGGRDVFVVKFAPDGAPVWAQTLGGAGFDDCHAIAVNASGVCSVLGSFVGPAMVGPLTLPAPDGQETVFVAQLAADGTPRWAIRTTGEAVSQPHRVAVDHAGHTYAALAVFGETTLGGLVLSNASPSLRHLARLDAEGRGRWVVPVPSQNDHLGMTLSPAGLVHVTGQDDLGRLFVAQYDGEGNRRWIAASEGFLNDSGLALAPDPLGNVVLVGAFQSNPMRFGNYLLSNQGITDGLAARIDAEGRVTWALSFGGTSFDRATGVAVDRFGTVFVAGMISGNADDIATFGSIRVQGIGADDAFLALLGRQLPTVPPRILSGPRLVAAYAGSEVTLSLSVEGTAPFSFSWLKDGVPIPGADASTLLLRDLRPSQEGSYVARVANAAGTDEHAPIQVRVADPLRLRLIRAPGSSATVVEFPTATQTRYTVEHRETADGGPWQTYRDLAGDGTPRAVELPAPSSSPGFYRVRGEAEP